MVAEMKEIAPAFADWTIEWALGGVMARPGLDLKTRQLVLVAACVTLAPPWVKHPEIPYGSIGWRMGSGEWYVWMFGTWFERLSESERAAYRERWQPPEDWAEFYVPIDDE